MSNATLNEALKGEPAPGWMRRALRVSADTRDKIPAGIVEPRSQ
jgi:hypothetical protein